ncbi:MAG TPA: FAD binding domain-containing protein [Jiangellales bacterium]|nr:FAD binding domain-containing protein [Jiangellales bacterium]
MDVGLATVRQNPVDDDVEGGETVDFLRPHSWAEALELRAEHPDALPLAGGTDVMVEINFDRRRPSALLDLTGVAELGEWHRAGGAVRLGAGVTWTRVITELAGPLPGLAAASRTVGSPQVRNRGTVGGNVGSASPAGDAHPVLLALGASVEVASVRGVRSVPVDDFFTGVKRSALGPDELIAAVHVPVTGAPQQFAKIGTRNAMVISVAAFGLALHPERRHVGTGIGSAAPTPVRARRAEAFLAGALEESGAWDSRGSLPAGVVDRFGDLVAGATSPIDDVRGTAAYRRHALSVLARRAVGWAWSDYQEAA